MSIDTTVHGMDKLLENLKQFPINIQKNVLVGAVRASAKPLVQAVKNNVPVDSGTLKKSIGINKRKTRNKSLVLFSVSPRKGGKNDGFYGHMIEFGTSKMAAHPFMRPAYSNQSNESIEEFKKYMAKRIPKEIQKARL